MRKLEAKHVKLIMTDLLISQEKLAFLLAF